MKLEISWASANAVTTRSTRLTKFGLRQEPRIAVSEVPACAGTTGFLALANPLNSELLRLTKFGPINWELLFSISWLNPRWLMDSMIILCSVRINSLIMQ